MSNNRNKMMVAFSKGAAVVAGWLLGAALIVLAFMVFGYIWRSLLRVVFGSDSCGRFTRMCAMAPTTLDEVLVWSVPIVIFIGASAYLGYSRFYVRTSEKRTTWPWPQE